MHPYRMVSMPLLLLSFFVFHGNAMAAPATPYHWYTY